MTQNRCKLFKAVMDTMPDKKPEEHHKMPWRNSKWHRKIDAKKLMEETEIKSPKLHQSPKIMEKSEADESIEQTIKMPFRYQF